MTPLSVRLLLPSVSVVAPVQSRLNWIVSFTEAARISPRSEPSPETPESVQTTLLALSLKQTPLTPLQKPSPKYASATARPA